jgi:GT2 family glycosyltransferase
MKFSVIIPTYNDWKRLMSCLIALEQQTIEKDQYEIIVVDNSESGIVPADINLSPKVQLVHEPEPGSYVARNKGAEIAVGEILVFTDSDCIPDKNWLANAKSHFSRSTCDLVGGRVDIFQTENGDKYGYLYERLTAFHQYKNVPVGRGVTANLFIKKSVFKEMGGFDSSVKSGGDWEFTLRCTEMGYRMIYVDDVSVLHPARDLVAIFKKQYRLTCGGALNVKKQYGHSYLRILGSHLLHGLNNKREYMSEPGRSERVIIFSIDFMKYLYRTIIYGGLLLRLIDPNKVRE